MIPEAAILHWRNVAPWPQDVLVEQDLILSRALVGLFQKEELAGAFALRGGTALHKLYFSPHRRYSEDIDLVQSKPGPIGPILDAARACLDPFLDEPRREHNPGNITLRYRMASEIPPVIPMRLKIEINTREHFSVFGHVVRPFPVTSPWFKGKAEVTTFTLEELLATKLRALYQRRKGRDLFDLHLGLAEKGVAPGASWGPSGNTWRPRGTGSPGASSRRTSGKRSTSGPSTRTSGPCSARRKVTTPRRRRSGSSGNSSRFCKICRVFPRS